MSSFKFSLDGRTESIFIIDDHKSLWLNYHVTKHIIINYEKEGFEKVLGIVTSELDDIRHKQTKDFNCAIKHELTLNETCKKCDFTKECYTLTKKLGHSYVNTIKDAITKDSEDPIHAHFERKRTPNSLKMLENILFIDKYGCSIICRKEKKNYCVFSCYRRAGFSNLSEIGLSFKKMFSDFELSRISNIKYWNSRLSGNYNNNVIKHLPENW